MRSGYPRFVRNYRIQDLIQHFNQGEADPSLETFLFSNQADCDFFQSLYQLEPAAQDNQDGLIRLGFPTGSKEAEYCRLFQQHTGSSISSRFAEDLLYQKGKIAQREFISVPASPASEQITRIIAKAHGPSIEPADVFLANSGANAFYSLFRAATEQARLNQKKIWVRLGWLYLDTIKVMQLLIKEDEDECVIALNKLGEIDRLEEIFRTQGDQIAGIVTEFPTNPLLESFDLVRVKELCDLYDCLLVVDPTMASPKNAKVSSFADVVVNSLTKYANWEGDVMMGSLVFPQHSARGRKLMPLTRGYISEPFQRDLHRMAEQIPFYESFIQQTNASTLQVAQYLENHPNVKTVHWAYQEKCSQNYEKVAGSNNPGCVLSIELNIPFETFYNSLEMLKSPSFGTEFTLCCPYVYLAHYSMMQTKAGQEELKQAGISPYLLRLSVGLEPVEEIISVLGQSLDRDYSKS
jgi:cystathionine gamma-synthase